MKLVPEMERDEKKMSRKMRAGELNLKVAANTGQELTDFMDNLESISELMETSVIIQNDRDSGVHVFMTLRPFEEKKAIPVMHSLAPKLREGY